MEEIKKVFVIGAGALGAVYASLLQEMEPGCVSLIADGERARRLRRDGLIVNGRKYEMNVAGPEENAEDADLLLVAVKNQHLSTAILDMQSFVGPETTIISVMNGIDSEEQIGAVLGRDKVLYCVALGIDAVRENDCISYTNQGRLIFGEKDNTLPTRRVQRVAALFQRAGIAYEIPSDMIRALWHKFMINVGINQVSAVLGAPYGAFQNTGEARRLMESAMREVIILAKKVGIDLSEEDIRSFDPILARLSPQGKTSMLQDVEAGRKTEVEMFAGRVIALGQKYDIPMPVNQSLFDSICRIESAYLKDKSADNL